MLVEKIWIKLEDHIEGISSAEKESTAYC